MTIIVLAEYRVEMVIEMFVIDRSSTSAGAGKKQMRRSAAPRLAWFKKAASDKYNTFEELLHEM
jgi:hypothetical protein